ncbi:MAG TPA: serine hydrolase [Phnomibacter sp.]|nr:serine hydrolase [Phnomibacter sp.]
MKIFYKLLLAGCMASAATNAQTSLPSFVQDNLDSYIQKGMEQWQVPGLAVVIVKDGKIVAMKGYGVKDIQSKSPVDEHTHFFIASNSKLFTGTVLANLEQQKKLNLNDPISKYFPEYKLYTPTSTSLVSIRDMLTHRIGTKTFQGDFTFWNTTLTRKEIMQKMRLLKPSQTFRQDYGYCNSCFMTAGEIVPKVIGKTWEQYVQDSILNVLGMSESFASSNGIQNRSSNIAVPYTTSYSGTLKTVPYDTWDNLGPAASVVSNVHDLSKWLLFQLDSGRVNGERKMPWETLAKTRAMQIVTNSRKSAIYPMNFRGYGLGLNIADYNGRQVYWHTGGAAGMVSNVCFIPDEKLGIAILTNNDNQNFFEMLRYQIMDAFLGVKYVDRSSAALPQFLAAQKEELALIASLRSRVKGNAPPLAFDAYVGDYTNELYGNITVTKTATGLLVRFSKHPTLTAALTYLDNATWLLEYNNIEYGIFPTSFTATPGQPMSLKITVNPFVEYDSYIFTKTK